MAKIDRLQQVQEEADMLREELGASRPGEVLYQAYCDAVDEDLIVVEAVGFGRATTRIVEGNYPVDYFTKFERLFQTEREAETAADEIATGKASASAVLGEPA